MPLLASRFATLLRLTFVVLLLAGGAAGCDQPSGVTRLTLRSDAEPQQEEQDQPNGTGMFTSAMDGPCFGLLILQ